MAKRIDKEYTTLDILEALYHYRALTVDQLWYVYYPNTKHYVYKRMSELKAKDLVKSERYKNTSCYMITQKGINELEKEGRVKKPRLAKNNLRDLGDLWRIIQANDIYAYLSPYGYEVIEMREWKQKHDMNRNARVAAGLVTKDGKEYSVYIVQKTISDEEIERLKKEIDEMKTVQRYVFLCQSPDSLNKYRSKVNKIEQGQLEFHFLSPLQLKTTFPLLASEQDYINLYSKYGEVRKNTNISAQNSFADHILITPDGKEHYICNYLYFDATKLERILTFGGNVAIFGFKYGIAEAREKLLNTPNIKYISIEPSDIDGFHEIVSTLEVREEMKREKAEQQKLRRGSQNSAPSL